jgi:hypothetical protein
MPAPGRGQCLVVPPSPDPAISPAHSTVAEAPEVLRRLLAAVEEGEIDAYAHRPGRC